MATLSNGIKLIYGAANLAPGFPTAKRLPEGLDFHDYVKQTLDILEKEGITDLDTSEAYPGGEEELGYHDAATHFTIDTKIPGGVMPGRKKEEIIATFKAQLEKMKTKQVNILFIHVPDTSVPFKEQLDAMNTLYKEGAFKYFGLSNFTTEQVQEVYDIASKNGWVLPTAYEGNYSAVARTAEEALFPTLRKLGIRFYAYSPIAGGFLAKTRAQVEAKDGRFVDDNPVGKLYSQLYGKTAMLDALDTWNQIADEAGIPKAEMAYRWTAYHSILSGEHGDGVIIGAFTVDRLKETIGYLKAGPLPDKVVEKIEKLWEAVKHDAPGLNPAADYKH